MLEIRNPSVPDALMRLLERQRLKYSTAKTVYHCVWDCGCAVGVFGDGANGAYEWFIWDDEAETVRTSDAGYGNPCVALCDGLVEAGASRANGDHDLYLTWTRRDLPAIELSPRQSSPLLDPAKK